MKQFTIAVLFLVSLVAQSRAKLVVCSAGTSDSNAARGAATDKCEEIIKNNRDSKDLAPIVRGRATLTQGNCVIFTNGDGVTRRELALQAQVIVDACSNGGYVAGQINGPTPNPVCIVSEREYVNFFLSVLMAWLKPSCVAWASLVLAVSDQGLTLTL